MFNYPNKVKLTIKEIESFPLCEDGKQVTIYDTALPGFALRIGKTAKTFIVYKRVAHGAPKRVTLGKYGQITLDEARKSASKKLAELSSGIDPLEEIRAKKAEEQKSEQNTTQTLKWLLDEYTKEHLEKTKGGKIGTIKGVKQCHLYFGEKTITLLKKDPNEEGKWLIDRQAKLSDWLARPFRSITREEILDRFNMFEVAKPLRVSKKDGLIPITRTHQMCFKYLSSAYNFIIPRLELDIKENFRNPVDVLSVYRKWTKPKKRTNMVEFRKEEFALWWDALLVYREHNEVASDYILFSLLQAGRSIEIANLKWDQVDFELQEVNYDATKNSDDYKFPLTSLALEILKRRKEFAINEFVFGYADSKTGHIPQDAKFHFKNIAEASGKLISHHDLRRTWGTAATWLDVNERIYNFLLKHKMNDVNEHYLMRNYDKIKDALQKVEDFFISQAAKLTATLSETSENDT